MSQKVKIQYTVDLQDLHVEVRRLTIKALDTLKEKANDCSFDKASDVLSPKMIDELDDVRKTLAEVDHALSEVMEIINSYLLFRNQSSTQAPEELNSESNIDPNVLAQRLNSFKKMMAAQEAPDEDPD
jgi:hypothetical protein